ncbi:MAG: efflux RND transporter permease subunit [Armatimonadetes bacterium]|nr:efflux RND transporter permease subunit [Armatimonadota bacterium]
MRGFNLVEWSVRHPSAVLSFYVAMVALAVVAIALYMPRRMMPYIESPQVGVVTRSPGMSAEEMETYYTKPIEQRMTTISGARYIRSTTQDGYSIVVLEFPYGADMQRKLTEVQALLTAVQDDLPMQGANAQPSWVIQIDPLNLPVLTLSITGDERWTPARIREVAENEIADRLKRTSGEIHAVTAFGGYRRQMQAIVDRNKLAARGLSILDVQQAIDTINRANPSGRLTTGDREEVVRMDLLARSAEELSAYPIRSDGDRTVFLRDVADVIDTVDERRSVFFHQWQADGKWQTDQAIALNVLQNPSASSPQVIAAVTKELAAIEGDYPGLKFRTAYNNAEFVDVLLKNLWFELALAVVLAGLVVWLFLAEWRMTLIALTAIPTSMAMAILALVPMGMSLNSSTLIGLLFSIGRLVDDAIIDLHAVRRHMKMGKDAQTATIEGISEVRRSVAASTLMIVIALVPLLFAGGIVEQMFIGLVWPLIFGLLASFLVSMTLTATLAARYLEGASEGPARFERWVIGPFQSLLDRMEGGYGRLIRWLLKHRFANLVRIQATLAVGVVFYYFIGSEMMPLGDISQAYLRLEMQPGASYAATEEATRRIQQIVQKHPEIRSVAWEVGAEGGPGYYEGAYFTGYAAMRENGATAMIALTSKDERQKDIWQVIDAIQEEAVATIPGVRLLQIKEMGVDVMATAAAPIQILIYGPDFALTSMLAEESLRIAKDQVPDLFQPGTSWTMGKPTWRLNVDLARAAQFGLSPEEIANQAFYATKGGYGMEFYRFPDIADRRQTTVLIRYAESQRMHPYDLEHLLLTNSEGHSIPLKSIAEVELASSPTMIERDGLRRVVSLMGYYRKGDYRPPSAELEAPPRPSMDVAMDVMMRAMSQINWPPREYGMEVRGDMTQMMDSFRRMMIGFLIAILLMYLALAAQFGGFLQPIQMVFSLPLELTGVFMFLYLMSQSFSTVSLLGIIVLTGMDLTAAILMIDLIMGLRAKGMPRDEAVIAGCTDRLRPILMTVTVTIAALAPVAFFPKMGTDAYQPLATAVVGGLIMGTALTLVDIPIMHTLADDLVRRFRRGR